MPATLEIPGGQPIIQRDLEAILDRMAIRESGGNPNVPDGKAGERGMYQIKPNVAQQYGIDPDLLRNPMVGRYVAKRYLTDLISQFKGDTAKGIAAYNAGPGNVSKGRIPEATARYVAFAMGSPYIDNQPGGTVKSPDIDPMLSGVKDPQVLAVARGLGPMPSWARAQISGGLTSGEIAPIAKEFFDQGLPPDVIAKSIQAARAGALKSVRDLRQSLNASLKEFSDPKSVFSVSRMLGAGGVGVVGASALSPRSANAAETVPESDLPPGITAKKNNFVPPEDLPAGVGKPAIAPPISPDGKLPSWVLPPPSTEKPEPLGARAASWLPTVGQLGGDFAGALGGAALSGPLGLTGVPEAAGAIAGGAAGSAGGAYLENKIRAQYGLPPVSVGAQAAWGGAGSAIGSILPFVPKLRKAMAVAKSEGISFSQAWDKVKDVEAGLEKIVGMNDRGAELLRDAPSNSVGNAYGTARATGLRELGNTYDTILGADAHKLTPKTAVQALQGQPGRILELAGKGLRQSVEDEFNKSPMTVNRVQKLISIIKAKQRQLRPDSDGIAIGAYEDIVKALRADRDAVIGATKAAAIKIVDQYYARQIARFPLKAVRKAHTEPAAAEAILKHNPTEVGRTLEVIREMERTGQGPILRRATASKIFLKAKVSESANPIGRIDRMVKAVKKIEPEVFDELYGVGAQKRWLDTAAAISKRERELLQHPNEAEATLMAVRSYLKEPGLAARMSTRLGHRLLFDAVIFGGGKWLGHAAGAGLLILYLEGMEIAAHSPIAMRLLQHAAASKDGRVAAKLIVSAMSTAIRAGAEKAVDEKK